MRKLSLLAVFFILCAVVNGCDSPTETKATSVTAPSLSEPPDNSSVSVTPTFKWTGAADKLEISMNSSFSNPIYSGAVSGTEFTLPAGHLQSGGLPYFWRAGKTNGSGMVWCASYWRFYTN